MENINQFILVYMHKGMLCRYKKKTKSFSLPFMKVTRDYHAE